MKTLSLTEVKNRFSELADDLEATHDHLTVTRNGRPSVVVLSAEEWESITETMFWLSVPGLLENLEKSKTEPTYSLDEVKSWIDAGRPDLETYFPNFPRSA